MTATTPQTDQAVPASPPALPRIRSTPGKTAFAAARSALWGLILRDLIVLWKTKISVLLRTVMQPFLLTFIFLYVFPSIGQGVGGKGTDGVSFATILVPGVVGLSILFQGVQSIALSMAQEFGFTREIEDRVQAPCPVWMVAVSKVLSGSVQGLIAAVIVFPIAAVVHAKGVEASIDVHWAIILTLIPLACIAMSSLGLLLGVSFEPRNIGLMFGFIILPVTFLGGTYYQWTKLAPVKIGAFHWLQTVVLVNPLIYVAEGMRAGLTPVTHMHLYIIYPVLIGFTVLFLSLGIRGFRRKVLS